MGNTRSKARSRTATPASSPQTSKKTPKSDMDQEIVWEWQDDSGWQTYDEETVKLIEDAYSSGATSVKLDHGYFGEQGGYTLDLAGLKQTKDSSGFSRDIRRTPPVTSAPPPSSKPAPTTPPAPVEEEMLEDIPPTTDGSPKWYCKNQNGKWEAYDNSTTRLIEGSYSNGMLSVNLNFGKFENKKGGFFIDFTEMVQIDQATKDSVEIKRNPPATKRTASKSISKTGEKEEGRQDTGFAEVEKSKAEGAKKLTQWKEVDESSEGVSKDDTCPICFCELFDGDGDVVVQLSKCTGHFFHKGCITHCYSAGYIQCPICNVVYGIRVGNMPPGTMDINRYPKGQNTLPGYENYGTIVINYNFPNGVQTQEHPHPGVMYTGTSRTAYLPDCPEGQEVLRLLQLGWERRLLFTVGLSRTTGSDDQVIWNGIHHKTNTSGGPTNFGFPDPTYFDRVKEELAAKGVV